MPLLPPVPPAPIGPFFQTLTGIATGESLTGSANADLIYGLGGNDTLFGGDGADHIFGGLDNDQISGGRGNDTLLGDEGHDRLFGGRGLDLIFGGSGNDLLQSGDDESTLVGGQGNDTLAARQLDGGLQWLFGGEGADRFDLQFVSAEPYSETVIGDFQIGVDSFTVDGVAGATVINAGSYITINGTQLFFTLASGDGLILDGPSAEQVFTGFGLTGNDTIIGDGSANRIFGGLGRDVLDGADGDDLLVGGDGDDTLLGGRGNDILGGNLGNDLLIGDLGHDTIYGHKGNDTLFGDDGDDHLFGSDQSSVLFGAAGQDVLQARMGSGGDSTLSGGSDQDAFQFFGLRAGRRADAVITDYEAGEAVLVETTDLGLYMQANALGFADVAGGARVDLAGAAGSITFQGWTAEDLALQFGWFPVAS